MTFNSKITMITQFYAIFHFSIKFKNYDVSSFLKISVYNYIRRDSYEFCLILIRVLPYKIQINDQKFNIWTKKIPYFFIRPYDLYKNLLIPGRVFSKQIHIL